MLRTIRTIRSAALFGFIALVPFSVQAAPETYNLDTSHVSLVWSINHFGFSNPNGKFTDVTGTIVLDEAAPATSKLNVKIAVGSLLSGVPKLDEHLKTKDFFDVAQFPDATFVSDKVEVTGKDTAKVTGTFTLHGVSKPLTLDVKMNKIAMNMMNKKTAGFTATTKLKRSDFGMSAYVPNLGDEVALAIEVEATLAEAELAAPAPAATTTTTTTTTTAPATAAPVSTVPAAK